MRYFQATQCQKALLLGIETILNVSYKGQESLLFNDFMSELINTKEWLEGKKKSSFYRNDKLTSDSRDHTFVCGR